MKPLPIAGLVIHEARAIPKPGQVFVFYGFRIRIISRHPQSDYPVGN
jgi:Mg2+/Co2+ transporter CorB